MSLESYKRKTPEEILLSISELHRKIYIDAVSGTGKTYHMLREGQALKKQGNDVVICAISSCGARIKKDSHYLINCN
jgi:two-component system sensor histidine kinase KdpD